MHKSIRNDFATALAKLAQALKVGDGLADGTQMGPLANPRRLTAMAEFTKDAVDRGATVLAGGERISDVGNFWQPTILADVPLEARVFNDEPFGPMAAIRSFDTLDDAIAEANRLPYGLAGYAYTKSLKNADLLSRRVKVACCGSICPRCHRRKCLSVASKTQATAPRVAPRPWRPI